MRTVRLLIPASAGVLLMSATGCVSPESVEPFRPLPFSYAARIVNANLERIEGTLRAVGSVDGHVTLEDGRRRSFHLDGTMFYLAPSYLRFDLKKLGETQLLLGSNEEDYWFYSKEGDDYHCGRHGQPDEVLREIPIEPRALIDALGLTPIPRASSDADPSRAVQRISEDHQQILIFVEDVDGRIKLEKEYWLDRYPPQLIGRVVFRDADGAVEMTSRLEDYTRPDAGGPRLPGLMVVDWPKVGTSIRFRIRRWTAVPQVKPSGVQFETPRECEGR
jgi:hypothetical protein